MYMATMEMEITNNVMLINALFIMLSYLLFICLMMFLNKNLSLFDMQRKIEYSELPSVFIEKR